MRADLSSCVDEVPEGGEDAGAGLAGEERNWPSTVREAP